MDTIDTNEIVRQAKEMRAAEMRRLKGLVVARLGQHARHLAGFTTESLRALFSGNHQAHRS
jgi:hypothetical protein